jgi:hypothetical protein
VVGYTVGADRKPIADPRCGAVGVFVVATDGRFIASAAAVATLTPGAQSPFAISIPGAEAVARYRVSFRADDRIVPHVDRRGRASPD